MPNIRGGKGYKSGKKKSKLGEIEDVEFIEVQPDQMVGRIVRILGDLNAHVYCQDNKQRVCKICRSVKKSVRFELGDIVLVSLRDCEVIKSELENGVRGSRGDILGKFHPYQFSELKESGVNSNLFGNIETVSKISNLISQGKESEAEKEAKKAEEEDSLFDRDAEEEEEEEEEEVNPNETDRERRVREGLAVSKKDKVSHRNTIVKTRSEEEINLEDL
jgi:initiation factor 1A